MAHTHDLEWEVGSRRIICMYDGCDFVMEEKDIIAIIGNHAAQQSVLRTANGACENCGNNCWKLVCETCGAE